VTIDDLFLFSAAITTENRNKPTAGTLAAGACVAALALYWTAQGQFHCW